MGKPTDAMRLPERARRFRELSAQALRDAAKAPGGPVRDNYVRFALDYASLAEDCEQLIATQTDQSKQAESEPQQVLPEAAAQAGSQDLSTTAMKPPSEPEPEPES